MNLESKKIPVKIQIASDLNIDLNFKDKYIEQKSNILCLAGNICPCGSDSGFQMFKDFILKECISFKIIIFVAGNREFYSNELISIGDIKRKLKSLEKEIPNFVFLNDEALSLNMESRSIVFIGTTLWTHIPDYNQKIAKQYINDYSSINVSSEIFINKKIKKLVRHLNVGDTQFLHENAKSFISSTIKDFENKENTQIVLVTHHKPIQDLYSHYNPYMQYTFQSNLINLITHPVVLAIHGNTNEAYDKTINNVRFLSNPYGFSKNIAYNNSLCVEI